MNYFTFYQLPIKFEVDKTLLRQQYLLFSKQFHPDYVVNESEEVRDAILAKSTLNNNAFKTLNNDALRLKYVLELTGTLNDQEKEVLPQDFLMEMMELNEQITDADAQQAAGIQNTIAQMEAALNAAMTGDCKRFDATGDKEILQQIKTNYLKQKYLLRIKESMLKFASL